MNREILFRGKRMDNGEWVYGFYVRADHHWHKYGIHKDWIICGAIANGGWLALHEKHAVKSDTIGQYTDITDKNGKKIFEGDIVKLHDKYGDWIAKVEFGNPNGTYSWGWKLSYISGEIGYNKDILLWVDMEEMGVTCEVIGNVFDNPELLDV